MFFYLQHFLLQFKAFSAPFEDFLMLLFEPTSALKDPKEWWQSW